jgi:putative membrane protein
MKTVAYVLTVLLWTGFAHAQTEAPTPHQLDAQLLEKLHEANQLEIAAGKLAQTQTPTPGIQKFGAQLIEDHTAADREVVALAKQEGVALHPANEAPLESLRGLKGAKFDSAFAVMMTNDHKSAVHMVEAAQSEQHAASVRALISKTLPVLKKHLHHAEQLENPMPHA